MAENESLQAQQVLLTPAQANKDEWLVSCVKNGDSFVLRQLLREGADPNVPDEEGMTAMHHAAALGARPSMMVLIKYAQCNFLARDHYGRYASDLAAEWAEDHALARLLRKKQCFQADEEGVPAWIPPGK